MMYKLMYFLNCGLLVCFFSMLFSFFFRNSYFFPVVVILRLVVYACVALET